MRGKLTVLAVLALLALQIGVARADLVGHWKLDEGSGDVATDATGNGHDGQLLNGPTWVEGYFDGGLEFNGAQQKVDIPQSPELNPTEEFSISLWANVNPDGTGHRSPITSRDDNPVRGYIIYVEPGNTWQFWIGTGIVGGAGWFTAQGPAADLGEWTHVGGTYVPGSHKLYINGEFAGEGGGVISPNTDQVLRIGGGATESAGNYFFDGMIDDVRVYDHALSEAQLAAVMANEIYPYAAAPKPGDGTMLGATATPLKWSPGELAVSHNVYLGTDAEAVANATPDDADLFLGSTTDTSVAAEALTPGATYYWRVDAVDESNPDSPWKGEVWSFWVQPDIAWAPTPADGISYINLEQDLTWEKGIGTLFHTVFFGESFDEVNDAVAGMMTADSTYDPGTLELGKTYYWRVDEFISPMQTNRGAVWSFTTLPDISVTDESLLAWWTLDEGEGTTVVDWSGHGHHGTLGGDAQWADGYFGSAMYFDGSGDYVDFGTPQDLYLPQNYTYTVWFQVGQNISGNSGTQYLLCVGSRSDLIFGVEDNVGVNGDLMLHYYDTAPGFHAVGVGKTTWSADEWHMVAGTRDENGHNIYLDGALVNSDTNTNEDNYATTRIISLGGRAWTGHQWYNGLIDDVRIYNRALD
ncbi:MAG: LamG domain-containing protein, partial [Sedimentisphaerales bacterium]|nr:LamG domain-containing protein [Sedimentisphaerales bacterium]